MTTLTAKLLFEDPEHNQAVVAIQTSRCFYRVAIVGSEVTVIGPGLEERIDLGDLGDSFGTLAEALTYKGMALVAVTMLEERE